MYLCGSEWQRVQFDHSNLILSAPGGRRVVVEKIEPSRQGVMKDRLLKPSAKLIGKTWVTRQQQFKMLPVTTKAVKLLQCSSNKNHCCQFTLP